MVSLGDGFSSGEDSHDASSEGLSQHSLQVPPGTFDLLTMLTDVGTHHVVKEFMEEYNQEGHLVLLWLELQEHKSIPSPSFRAATARKIVKKYIVGRRHGHGSNKGWTPDTASDSGSGGKKRPSLENLSR
jgi:hypothetical protein